MVNHIRQVQSVNLSQKSRDEKIHQKNFLITKKFILKILIESFINDSITYKAPSNKNSQLMMNYNLS